MSNIILNLELPLSPEDKETLLSLAGEHPDTAPHTNIVVNSPQAKPEEPKPKAKPGPKPKTKPEPAKEEPAPEPEPELPKEETPADPETPTSDGPTLQDAVGRASELLSDGRADDVKAALASLGVQRVSQLKAEQVPDFLKELG